MPYGEILSNLFVGSHPRTGADLDALAGRGVDAVLNLQTEEDLEYLRVDWAALRAHALATGVQMRRVPIRDFDDDALRDGLPEAVRTLEELIGAGRTAYVHCSAGVNRSASVVISYLHWCLEWELEEAERHVRKCHPCSPVMEVIRRATRDRKRRDL